MSNSFSHKQLPSCTCVRSTVRRREQARGLGLYTRTTLDRPVQVPGADLGRRCSVAARDQAWIVPEGIAHGPTTGHEPALSWTVRAWIRGIQQNEGNHRC